MEYEDEEINHDLGLTFQYQWNSSDKFGFVKKSAVINNTDQIKKLIILDGIQNILPNGIGADMQNSFSNLVDAYKKSELEGPLGIYALSAVIVDKPEPSEALKATTVWSTGIENATYLYISHVKGEFVGGCDIIVEMTLSGELDDLLIENKVSPFFTI